MRTHVVNTLMLALVSLVGVNTARGQFDLTTAESKKIACIRLSGDLVEKPVDETLPFSMDGQTSLKDLVERLADARDDDSVKAVVLTFEGISLGLAQIEELRQAMDKVRAADKEVWVHVEAIGTGLYTLACAASEISMVPTGELYLLGIFGETPYLRGLLDKMSVEPDFVHIGAYKSAAEILTRTGPSKEADEMHNWLMDSIFDTIVTSIARSRAMTEEQVRKLIDGGPYSAEQAKEAGLIDRVEQRQDFAARIQKRYGGDVELVGNYGKDKKSGLDIDPANPFAIFQFIAKLMKGPEKSTEDSVAIVYVEGAIAPGKAPETPFGSASGAFSTNIRKALDEAAEDDSVKAVVLRVDSPGGSAMASEIIWYAGERVRANKPFVVSMGNVAGSGGYYVACGADTIFADAGTITASIGVVGGKLVTTAGWNRLGITWKSYQRGARAGLMSSAQRWSDTERALILQQMKDIYGVFKGHIQDRRAAKLKKPLEEMAGGRVFTGAQALELGLVDRLGTLHDAVRFAAAQANIGDYEVRVIPAPENLMDKLMKAFSGGEDDEFRLSVGSALLSGSSRWSLVKAALPYVGGLDPQRFQAVVHSLQFLELLQRETVVAMMPYRLVIH